MKRIGTFAAAAVGAWLAAAPLAWAAADIGNGERLARRWCAECHVVAPDQKTANADVPAFATIGADPAKTPEGLATLLAVPERAHSKMQNLNLSRTEIADVVAYIQSLKP